MTIASELRSAIGEVNIAFGRLSAEVQEALDLTDCSVDQLLDRLLLEGDDAHARAAIRAWQSHYLRLFEEAANE